MSKKLLFLYITSSALAVLILLIIGLIAKVIFGGLNVNFLEQRLSSYLKTEYDINLKSNDLTLMHNDDIGVFIDISKTDLILRNETSLSSSKIKIDFKLIDLLYKKKGQLIKIMAEEVAIKSDQINNVISLNDITFVINSNSLGNLQDLYQPNFLENLTFRLSGKSELGKILPKDQFYNNFGNLTSVDLEISKSIDQFTISISEFKNDKISFKQGSYITVNENFKNSNVNLITTINKEIVLDYIRTSISVREENSNKVLSFFEKNLTDQNNLILNFDFNPSSDDVLTSISNLTINSQGKINSNFVFDDNKNPNYTSGAISYDIQLSKLLSDNPIIKGVLDLTNIRAFIRQINLNKFHNEVLKIKFDSNINNDVDSEISFKSVNSKIELDGRIRISKTNHLFLDSLKLNNAQNVQIKISGDLSKRVLNLSIDGEIIDLSMNKILYNKKVKDHYLSKENYKIKTNKAIFAGGVKVSDFKAGISKQGELLSVNSKANIDNHTLDYSREKNEMLDVNLISSSDVTYFVNDSHPAKKLLSDGEFKMKSVRDLKTMDAEVEIDLKDFVLINSPASLKILSLPSISGLVSIAEGEEGIRFGYGQISYIENEKIFRNIDAYAVSDSIGLVMEGKIQREEAIVDMSGEISPMHLVNAIIQNVPILGPIIVGDEGEGLFSIDFSLTGDVDNPEVSSNPLTIIKPRIIERALESINSNKVIQ